MAGKTIAAIDRTVGSGLERNCAIFAARCANGIIHFALSPATPAVFAGITAVFASLGLVIETLLLIEILFTRSEYKFLAAILANDRFVLKNQWKYLFFSFT